MVIKSNQAMKTASIIIPHYDTPEPLAFCLRCIEHFSIASHEVIVVDNGSTPETLARLEDRDDIMLLKRKQDPSLGQTGHKAALDLGISRATGQYIIAIHTDTFVIKKGWIKFLADRLTSNEYLAMGPSTHRLYPLSFRERLKWTSQSEDDRHWIRPVFTIYHRDIFKDRKFMDYKDVGEISESFVKSGRAGFLSREEASAWAFHVGGTTRLYHLQHRRKAKRKKERLVRAFLASKEMQCLIQEGESIAFLEKQL